MSDGTVKLKALCRGFHMDAVWSDQLNAHVTMPCPRCDSSGFFQVTVPMSEFGRVVQEMLGEIATPGVPTAEDDDREYFHKAGFEHALTAVRAAFPASVSVDKEREA